MSGINFGANLAEDLSYSGTVGAALEARGLAFPSIAISAAAFKQPGSEKDIQPNFLTAGLVAKDLIQNIESINVDASTTLNVNVPNINYLELREILVTKLGSWGPRNPPIKDFTSNGEDQFWITHRDKIPLNDENSDISALSNGSVSITPIYPNFSMDKINPNLSSWLKSFKNNE